MAYWRAAAVAVGTFAGAMFDLYGAAGGGTGGGGGAHVTATIAVRPRTVLTIVVGGKGGDPVGIVAGAGGFGGGAPGGAGSETLQFGDFTLPGGPGGGGGGGASDVRTGAEDDLASRLLIAGGGGGGSDMPGGASGAEGQPGADGVVTYNFPESFPPEVVAGGAGGTATSGGVDGGIAGQNAPPTRLDFIAGRPIVTTNGGGGGGLFGGGGGASAGSGQVGILSWQGTSAGGGGGSSLVAPDAKCPPVIESGVSLGDGSVVVTFRRGHTRRHICRS